MKWTLQQYAAFKGIGRLGVEKEVTAGWQINRQRFQKWWERGSPTVRLVVDGRTYRIRRIEVGEINELPRREK